MSACACVCVCESVFVCLWLHERLLVSVCGYLRVRACAHGWVCILCSNVCLCQYFIKLYNYDEWN